MIALYNYISRTNNDNSLLLIASRVACIWHDGPIDCTDVLPGHEVQLNRWHGVAFLSFVAHVCSTGFCVDRDSLLSPAAGAWPSQALQPGLALAFRLELQSVCTGASSLLM